MSEPCLYIKIRSQERREKEGQRGSPGSQLPPNRAPSAGQAPRIEAGQLDFYTLKSGPFVHEEKGVAIVCKLGRMPGPLCRSIEDTNNACKTHYSQTTPLTLMAQRSGPWARKCQN